MLSPFPSRRRADDPMPPAQRNPLPSRVLSTWRERAARSRVQRTLKCNIFFFNGCCLKPKRCCFSVLVMNHPLSHVQHPEDWWINVLDQAKNLSWKIPEMSSIRLDAETIAEKQLSEKTLMNPISGVNYFLFVCGSKFLIPKMWPTNAKFWKTYFFRPQDSPEFCAIALSRMLNHKCIESGV